MLTTKLAKFLWETNEYKYHTGTIRRFVMHSNTISISKMTTKATNEFEKINEKYLLKCDDVYKTTYELRKWSDDNYTKNK